MGREAAGVRGVKLSDEQRVNALIVAEDGFILTASQNGFGKLTPLEDFPKHGRGGQGVIALQITDRNGIMVGALQVSLDDEIMLMSQNGVLVRTPVKDISVVGTQYPGRAIDSAGRGRSALRARAHRGIGGRGRGCGRTNPTDPADPADASRSGDRRLIRFPRARLQFLAGTCRAAARGSGAGARRTARLARQRHVGHGNQPSQQGLRRGGGASRGGSARADVDTAQLQGAVHAGRRLGAILLGADESCGAPVHRRLHEYRALVRKGASPKRRDTARSTWPAMPAADYSRVPPQ